MAQLAALLRTDLSRMAEEVRKAGRGKDTILAHITPREAALLKARGGSGELNPNTGLPEFQTDDEMYGFGYEGAPYTQPYQTPSVQSSDITIDPNRTIDESGAFGGIGLPTPESGGMTMPLSTQYTSGFQMPDQTPDISQFYDYGTPQIDLTRAGGIGGQGFGATEPIELGIAGGMAGAPSVSPPQEKSVLDRIQAGLKTPLGYGALGALPAILQSRRAASQARGLQQELGKLGAEARTAGQQLVQQAQAGQLPAAQQQALEAQRLAAMQNLQRRGVADATAMAQVENQLTAQRAKFIDDTLNQGLKLINVADQYTAQAIKAGYQADQQAQNLLGNFFQNYMRILAGQPATTPPGKP